MSENPQKIRPTSVSNPYIILLQETTFLFTFLLQNNMHIVHNYLSKAFDCKSFNILFEKLKCYYFDAGSIALTKSYLTNRCQKVKGEWFGFNNEKYINWSTSSFCAGHTTISNYGE